MNTCKNCETLLKKKRYSNNSYCSTSCQHLYQNRIKVDSWLSGEFSGWVGKTKELSNPIRAYVYQVKGTACEVCGWDMKHPVDGKTLTEIDHIDGDAENCKLENLRVLCPNCHSMTPTFRARNKNSKRIRK